MNNKKDSNKNMEVEETKREVKYCFLFVLLASLFCPEGHTIVFIVVTRMVGSYLRLVVDGRTLRAIVTSSGIATTTVSESPKRN